MPSYGLRGAKPEATPETASYWQGLREGELRLQRCTACRESYFPPRPFCPRCGSREVEGYASSGRSTLYSYVIDHVSARDGQPYAVAVVQLEEGPRLMTNLVEIAQTPDELVLDMALEVAFDWVDDDVTLPKFRPAAGPRA